MTNPQFSALLLAPDPEHKDSGILYAHELSRLDLRHTRLAVLAGCTTARGSLRAGEGALSLSHAILMAGASTVIASVTQLSDKASEFSDRSALRVSCRTCADPSSSPPRRPDSMACSGQFLATKKSSLVAHHRWKRRVGFLGGDYAIPFADPVHQPFPYRRLVPAFEGGSVLLFHLDCIFVDSPDSGSTRSSVHGSLRNPSGTRLRKDSSSRRAQG